MKSDSHRHTTRLLSIVIAILISSGALLLNTARPLSAEGEGFTLSTTTSSVSESGSTGTFTAVLDVQPAGGSWSGTTGTVTTADAMTGGDPGGGSSWVRLATGTVKFSISGNDTFWLYAWQSFTASPAFSVARLQSTSNCGGGKNYDGFQSLSDITNAAAYSFSTGYDTMILGTYDHSCDSGLMLFKQNNRYGVLKFLDMPGNGDNRLTVQYWIGDEGVTDFSSAGEGAAEVVLSVTSADTGEATVSPSTLTFTDNNWDSAQTVTVTGVNDSLADGSQTTAVTIAVVEASSADA